jgi:hypothetical protein
MPNPTNELIKNDIEAKPVNIKRALLEVENSVDMRSTMIPVAINDTRLE